MEAIASILPRQYEINVECRMCHKLIVHKTDPIVEEVPIPDWCPLGNYGEGIYKKIEADIDRFMTNEKQQELIALFKKKE